MEQSTGSKRGEIEFRRQVVGQQVRGEDEITDELPADEIERILLRRMETTLGHMTSLARRLPTLSPYVEIGAERCQRALVMENDVGASGAAADLSYDMLEAASHYSAALDKPRLPVRICCDVNNMPFLTDSVPFVYCYETLHHFPSPTPVVAEIHRVLRPGGWFFFAEEPYRKMLHANLYKGSKLYSDRSRTRSFVRRAMDYFFAEMTCNELEYGVIENHSISPSTWREALSCFEGHEVQLQTPMGMSEDLHEPQSWAKYFLAYLLGGAVSGLCRKPGEAAATEAELAIACPSCLEQDKEVGLEFQPGMAESIQCPVCDATYPVVNGITFLLTPQSLYELYPEVARQTAN